MKTPARPVYRYIIFLIPTLAVVNTAYADTLYEYCIDNKSSCLFYTSSSFTGEWIDKANFEGTKWGPRLLSPGAKICAKAPYTPKQHRTITTNLKYRVGNELKPVGTITIANFKAGELGWGQNLEQGGPDTVQGSIKVNLSSPSGFEELGRGATIYDRYSNSPCGN